MENKKVWFVGSNPSRKNDDKMTPFYGTRSYLTLLSWIATLGVKNYGFINASNEFAEDGKVKITQNDYIRLQTILGTKSKVVALGRIASDALNRLNIKHFPMPHPSPRNRQHNDHTFISERLTKCKEYLSNS
jgi:uracil-DNA glycosylase